MKLGLFILLLVPIVNSLFDSVRDTDRWNEEHLLNVITFSKDAIENLKIIVPEKNSFNDKKRAFLKFCDIYGTENRTAIAKLFNQLVHVYNEIPDNFQKMSKTMFNKFVDGIYTFDMETFAEIGAIFDEEYARGDLMKMWNSKNAFDRHLKTFRKIFYSPLTSQDMELETTEVGRKIGKLIFYIFGEKENDSLSESKKVNDEL